MRIESAGEAAPTGGANNRLFQPRIAASDPAAFDQKLLEVAREWGQSSPPTAKQASAEAAGPAPRVASARLWAAGSGARPSNSFQSMVKARAERWQTGQRLAAGHEPLGAAAASPLPEGSAVSASGARPLEPEPTPRVGSQTAPRVELEPTPAVGPREPLPGTRPMALSDFPRPAGDNGRGIHWVPTPRQAPDVVDRFVKEAKAMHMKWVVFLNDGTNLPDNEYLVRKLTENGIMPVMRIYTPNGAPIQGDLEALVRHYRALGVHYFQLYNEPNLICENQGQFPDVGRYLDMWIPAARAVVNAGGLPGFGALAPGGNFDDLEFFKQALDGIIQRGQADVLDNAWISLHNYTLNHPLDYMKDSNGFLKFRWYDQVVREKLGRRMAIIGTEGGTYVGASEDKTLPAISQEMQIEMVKGAYEYMRNAEPYFFAHTYWIIANEAGGGMDKSFRHQALFAPRGQMPVVDALKGMSEE